MKTRVAAIEFGTSKIVTVIAQSSNGKNNCEILSCGRVDYAGYSAGDWTDWEHLATAIYNSIITAESTAGVKINDLYIGVPCEFINVRTAEAQVEIASDSGRVTLDDIHAVEDMAAEMLNFKDSEDLVIHRSPAWYSVDAHGKTMQPEGMKGNYLKAKVSFVTAAADFVDDMRSIMGELGKTINGFLSPTLGEQLLATKVSDRDDSCIFIDSGMYNTEFSVLRGDAMVYHAVLPCGGNDITEYLADELEIRYDEAELLKRSAVVGEDRKTLVNPPISHDREGRRIKYKDEIVCGLVEAALDDVCEMLRRTQRDAQRELAIQSVVYLSGGGIANLRGGDKFLARKLDRKVYTVDIKSNKLGSPEYASVLGLVDLIFDSIEQRIAEQETLPMRVVDTFKGLFGRSKSEDDE